MSAYSITRTGAHGGTRTHTPFQITDFESVASANSATRANRCRLLFLGTGCRRWRLHHPIIKLRVVEDTGLEPVTSCLQGKCSPRWANPPYNMVLKSTNYTSLPFKASVLLLSGSWSVPEVYWHSDLSALPTATLIALSLSYSFAKGEWQLRGELNPRLQRDRLAS